LDDISATVNDIDNSKRNIERLDALAVDKNTGLQKLEATIQLENKLHPDTSSFGRDAIRQKMAQSKAALNTLTSNITDLQRKCDASTTLQQNFTTPLNELKMWLSKVEEDVKKDKEIMSTLPEKRKQLQANKVILQDVVSHSRMLESVLERGRGLQKASSSLSVGETMNEVESKFKDIQFSANAAVSDLEQHVSDHSGFNESSHEVSDWLRGLQGQKNVSSDLSGDKYSIVSRLDQTHSLIKLLNDGKTTKLIPCEEIAKTAMLNTGPLGQEHIQGTIDQLDQDSNQLATELLELQTKLGEVVEYWTVHESDVEKMNLWLKTIDKEMKDAELPSTVEQKRTMVKKYQDLVQQVKDYQQDVDRMTDHSQILSQLSGNNQVSSSAQQMTMKYNSLATMAKDILRKSEQNVSEHEVFLTKRSESTEWIQEAEKMFDSVAKLATISQEDLEQGETVVKELLHNKSSRQACLAEAVEAGESLYANLSVQGRDIVRNNIKTMRQNFDNLYDKVAAFQRHLEVHLVEWTSFSESLKQVESWLKSTENQFGGDITLLATLDEKKSQLLIHKGILQDVVSYERIISNVQNRAKSFVKSADDSQVSLTQINDAANRYKLLCTVAKKRVNKFEEYVKEHRLYQNYISDVNAALSSSNERLVVCSDVSGDANAVQNRLARLEDSESTWAKIELMLTKVKEQSSVVIPQTSIIGQESILREIDDVMLRWTKLQSDARSIKANLSKVNKEYKDVNSSHTNCSGWLQVAEDQLAAADWRAVLADKQKQLHEFINLDCDMESRQIDIDDLSNTSQALAKTTQEIQVENLANQLVTRYQSVSYRVKVLDHIVCFFNN